MLLACGLADRTDKAWIQTFADMLASSCSYFSILLVRLLQLNHGKICLFWDQARLIQKLCDLLDTVNIYWFWRTNYEAVTYSICDLRTPQVNDSEAKGLAATTVWVLMWVKLNI